MGSDDAPAAWLKPVAKFRLVAPRAGVSEAWLKLCSVSDIAYLREAMQDWRRWTTENAASPLLFNWVSIRNFHPGNGARLYCLDSTDEMISLGRPLFGFGTVTFGGLGAEALMLVKSGHVIRCDEAHRNSLVYVSFLEVAPWNHPLAAVRYFRGLGPLLLRAACQLSVERGYKGRLGLHAVPAARDFYSRIGFQVIDCPNEYNELYMELDEAGARALLGAIEGPR